MKLYERGGKLWIDFFYLSKRYRRTLGLDATKANIRLAESKIIPEVTYKLSQGTFFEIEETQVDKDITVDEMAKISFEIHKCERREFTRISIASNYERHIKKPFGKKSDKKYKALRTRPLAKQAIRKISP